MELNPRERTILEMRWGLAGFEPHTTKEVANKMRVTRERIRQIENKAIRKLNIALNQ